MNILFFDGHCNLCNGLVSWLIRVDKKSVLKFASLQGETAKEIVVAPKVGSKPEMDTVVYMRNGKRFERSSAVLLALADFGGPWKIVTIFLLIPKGFRDFAYILVAKNRYRIFGKKESCRIPTSDEKSRFLP